MMPSRNRRVRVLATLALGVVMIWLWSRNTGIADVYRQRGADKAVGGGSVLRPGTQDVPWNPPPHVEPETKPEPPPPLRPQPSNAPKATTTTTSTESSTSAAVPAKPPGPSLGELVSGYDDLDFGYHGGQGQGRVEASIDPSQTTSTVVHWTKQPERFPISSTIQLPTGTSKPFPRIQRAVEKLSEYGADQEKLAVIKAAGAHSWKGYRDFAFAHDEVKPVSAGARTSFGGWGATLVDSLDTLWLMGMEKEFEEAVEAVGRIDFTTSLRSDIPLFETVIRFLGGFVAAYDVSGREYRTLLDKAVELAEILYATFDTPNRMPLTYYRWKPSAASQARRAGTRIVLAEVGTLSLEFTRLAQLTGEPKYYDAIARITDLFADWQNNTRLPGFFPTTFDASGCGKPPPVEKPATKDQQLVSDGTPRVAPGVIVGSDDRRLERLEFGVGDHDDTAHLHAPGWNDDDEDLSDLVEKTPPTEAYSARWERRDEDLLEHPSNTLMDSTSAKRAPPDIGPLPIRDDEVCLPQGFVSTSKNNIETFTLSGASDSMYEYLPKEHILLGGQVDKYRTMYLDSAAAAIENLLFKPMTVDERDILMSGDLKSRPNYSQPIDEREYIEQLTPQIAHLACFAGGMFAMGGVLFDKPEHVEIGSKITDGCVWAYNITSTGIMPEEALVMACEDTWGECKYNESAWWAQLDPYVDTRTKVFTPVARPTPAIDRPGTPRIPADAPHIGSSRNDDDEDFPADAPHIGLSRKDDEEDLRSDDTRVKRQLQALPSESLGPPKPLRHPYGNPSSSQNAPNALYTPPPPLSHQDYVEKKIEEERLPPGFIRVNSRKYILRPEAIESVFYMYRITGDQYWREVGWNMFTAIQKHTRAPHGYSAIDDITKAAPEQIDQMESFWVAETLKYFFLLFDDPDNWSLDEWVLNTEAHLFRRPAYEFSD